MTEDLKLSELLAVKLCHDLSGPIGAVNNGAELLADANGDLFNKALELVGASARDAVARILFFRQAYGTSGSQSGISIESLKILTDNFYAEKNIHFSWSEQNGTTQAVSNEEAKIILTLILIVTNCLVHGGDITIQADKKRISIRGDGKTVKFDMEVLALLSDKAPEQKLSVKNIHSYMVSVIAKSINLKTGISTGDNFIEITAS
ncbi:MAG: hypothetical protein K0R98_935 [Rickettsiaceae bacterium]|jgi:histidine phosphotransferase ChpT|nr:hypothetical protein [Rickettsiaceae bacterium]MCE3269401.1 hypothetical protein [Burkholderiales bacterium]